MIIVLNTIFSEFINSAWFTHKLNTKCVSELGQVYKLINSETIAFNTYVIPIQSQNKNYPISIVIKPQHTVPIASWRYGCYIVLIINRIYCCIKTTCGCQCKHQWHHIGKMVINILSLVIYTGIDFPSTLILYLSHKHDTCIHIMHTKYSTK